MYLRGSARMGRPSFDTIVTISAVDTTTLIYRQYRSAVSLRIYIFWLPSDWY